MAVAGFVLSILALILSWLSLIDLIFLIPAIVFSAIGLRRANRHGGTYRGLAISGLWISLVAAVVMIVLTIVFVRAVDDIVDRVSLSDDGVSLSEGVLTLEDEFFDIHLEVEVVGITRGYPGDDFFLEPGNEWVRVVVEVENLSGDDHRFRGFDFDLVDADGEAFGTWVGHPDTGDLIDDKTIPARSVTRGDVVRQAPISASQMALAVDVFSFDTRYLKIDLDSLPTVDPPAPAPPAPAPPAPTPPPAETLADCRQGMTLQPGEACRYTGGDSPPATVVLSVDRDGAICREGGPARRFGATIEHIRLCTNGFDRDDTFNTNIRVRQNPDSSWEVTSSP